VKTYFRPKQQISIKGFGRPGAFDVEKATKKQWWKYPFGVS
jgi:RNA-binding protein YlmH